MIRFGARRVPAEIGGGERGTYLVGERDRDADLFQRRPDDPGSCGLVDGVAARIEAAVVDSEDVDDLFAHVVEQGLRGRAAGADCR